MICCHSPGGDTAADRAFFTIYTHQRAIMRQPWRSLRSMSAFVIAVITGNKIEFDTNDFVASVYIPGISLVSV